MKINSYFKVFLILLAVVIAIITHHVLIDSDLERISKSQNSEVSDTTKARLWFEEGVELTGKSRYDSSISKFERAANIYMRDSLWGFYVDCMNYLGDNYRRLGRYDTAFTILSLNIKRSVHYLGEENSTTAMAINKMGLWYMDQGDDDKATDHFERALWIRKKVLSENHTDMAWSYNNLGMVNYNRGYFALALKNYELALEIFIKSNGSKSAQVAVLSNNIASVYQILGNHDKALEYIDRSLQIRQEIFGTEHVTLAENYTLMGTAYLRKGDLDKAFKLYQRAFSINEKQYGSSHPAVGNNCYNLGFAFKEADQIDTALVYYRKAFHIWVSNYGSQHPVIARVSDEIGELFLQKNNFDSALTYFNIALDIWHRRPGVKGFRRAHEYSHIGTTYMKIGDFKTSMQYYNQALSVNLEYYGSKHLEVSLCYSDMANVYRSMNAYVECLEYLQKAIDALVITDSTNEDVNRTLDVVKLMLALEKKGDVLREYYQSKPKNLSILKKSFDAYTMAVQWLDRTRREYVSEDSKILIGQRMSGLYEKTIQTSLELFQKTTEKKYLNQAFMYSETSKSFVLSEVINLQYAKQFAGIPDSLLMFEDQLRNRIGVYNKKLFNEQNSGGYGSQKFRTIQDILFQLNGEYEKHLKHIEQSYPQLYALKYRPLIMSLEDIYKTMPDSTILIEYFVGKQQTYLFCVDKNECRWVTTSGDSLLNKFTQTLSAGLQTRDFAKYSSSAFFLYNNLIKPFENIKANKLIIVPDGVLSTIPFETLLSSSPQYENYSNLEYLIKKYSISYAYSASLLFHNNSIMKSQSNNFIGFAPTIFK